MKKGYLFVSIFTFSLFFLQCKKKDSGENLPNHEIVLLISLDGFRHDYFEKTNTPGLDRIVTDGVKAESLIPVFPASTFPNHYTQVTGLYPENHGIIANVIYDPIDNDWYTIGTGSTDVAESKWYHGEPLWVTAEKQGQTAATYFWPGSEAEIQGTRPSHWKPYDGSISNEDRVQQVLEWLDLPNGERPSFISLYFSDVDSYGHGFGPDAPEIEQAIQIVDNAIVTLLDGIETRGFENSVNIIVVSDHGMTQMDRNRTIFLDDYMSIDPNDVNIINWGSLSAFTPKPGTTSMVYNQLKDAHPNLKVYLKDSIPERLHYSDYTLIPEIVGIPDEGWMVTSKDFFENNQNAFTGGAHGYDFEYPSMHGIFIAKGPAFRENIQPASFQSVHLYELMCKILNLNPAENDGDFSVVAPFLK